jgi:hypothetical protein
LKGRQTSNPYLIVKRGKATRVQAGQFLTAGDERQSLGLELQLMRQQAGKSPRRGGLQHALSAGPQVYSRGLFGHINCSPGQLLSLVTQADRSALYPATVERRSYC